MIFNSEADLLQVFDAKELEKLGFDVEWEAEWEFSLNISFPVEIEVNDCIEPEWGWQDAYPVVDKNAGSRNHLPSLMENITKARCQF